MPAVIGSIEVTLKLLGADRFQQDARAAGSSVEGAANRITRATGQASAATDRLKQSVSSIAVQNSAFRSLGFAALRANTSVGTLTQGVYLLTAALGGLGTAFAARAFTNFADTYTNITNRLNATLSTQRERVQAEQNVYDIAQRSRVSLDATSRLYSRLTQSARELGVTQEQIAQATETSMKALTTGGATTQEAASVATQLAQALGSGRLAGDELRSIAENSPVLIDAIAREFGVAVGGLKDLGAQGLLTSDRVLKGILSAQAQVEAAFQRTNPTIAAGIQQIDNALTRYIGTADKAWGASNALARGLGLVAENMESIGDSVKYAALALGGSFLLRRAGSSSQEGTIIGDMSKKFREDRALLNAEVDNAKFDIAKANADLAQARQRQAAGGFAAAFGGRGGGDQDLLNERKAALSDAERAQERYRKAREAYAAGEQRLGQITATLGPQFTKALESEDRARSKLADTMKKLDAARTASDLAARVADAPGATRAQQNRVDVAERRVRELTTQLQQQAADVEARSSRVSGMADASQETARQQRIAVIREQGLRDEQRTEAFRQTVAANDRVRTADAALMASQRAAGARTAAEAQKQVTAALEATTAATARLTLAERAAGQYTKIRAAGTAAFDGVKLAATGLYNFLGGPLGVALAGVSAGLIAYEVIQNRAALAAEKHANAVKLLASSMESLKAANAAGTTPNPEQLTGIRTTQLGGFKAARDARDQFFNAAIGPQFGAASAAGSRMGVDFAKQLEELRSYPVASDQAQASARMLLSVLEQLRDTSTPGEAAKIAELITLGNTYLKITQDAAAYEKQANKAADAAYAARFKNRGGRAADERLGEGLFEQKEIDRITSAARDALAEAGQRVATGEELSEGIRVQGDKARQALIDSLSGMEEDAISTTALDDALKGVGSSLETVKSQLQAGKESTEESQKATDALRAAMVGLSGQGLDFQLALNALAGLVQGFGIAIGQANALKSAMGGIPNPTAGTTFDQDAGAARNDPVIRALEGQAIVREQVAESTKSKTQRAFDDKKKELVKSITDAGGIVPTDINASVNKILAGDAAAKGGGGGKPKLSEAAKDAKKLHEAMEELRQDAAVAALSELDQQTVRFAQSSGVATKNIEQFIAAMKSGDMDAIPADMQAIRQEIEKLEAIKFGRSQLDELFPAREMTKQLDQLRMAAEHMPEVAANLRALEMQVELKFVNEEIKDFTSSISEFAQSAVKDFENIGDAVENLVDRLLDSALRAAFKPAEDALNGFMSNLFRGAGVVGGGGGSLAALGDASAVTTSGISSFAFHRGGRVGQGAPDRRSVSPGAFVGAPVLHKGLSGREFPAILEYGERVLTRRMEERNVATMSGLASVAATSPRPTRSRGMQVNVSLEGAKGNQEVAQIADASIRQALRRYDKSILTTIDNKKARA